MQKIIIPKKVLRVFFIFASLVPLLAQLTILSHKDSKFTVNTYQNEVMVAKANDKFQDDQSNDQTAILPTDPDTKLNAMTNASEIEAYILQQAKKNNIKVESFKTKYGEPNLVTFQTYALASDSQNQSNPKRFRVILGSNYQEVSEQMRRLELVLKGVDFSKFSDEVVEIDVRYNLPVLRTQMTELNESL
jgi:hypothetical protein